MKVFISCCFLASGILLLPACASKQTPRKDAADGSAAKIAGAGGEARRYVVQRGDSLWDIAAKPAVLGDAFRWPILYKQNRDQIQDPDLIEIRQDLGYHASYDKAAVDEAVRLARETPPYVPHSSPRKSLPLKY